MGSKHRTIKVLLVLLFGFISITAQATPKILVWGDSLSAAYGISVEKGWVSLMQKELADKADITNASISGETTQGGLTRLPAALQTYQPDYVILELGANDGLRGISPKTTKINLQKMILLSQKRGAKVLLLGMKIPPNYGMAYSKKFEAVFSDLSKEYDLPFIPFFLNSIIEDRSLLQKDDLHPTAKAQPLLLKEVLPAVINLLKEKLIK